ncbi:MAG: sugar transferase [Acutalibacteraceae bacterium]|jgi:exopolysaccharide biosynthesis polyprenyl glycosylphosphotransferase
MKTFEQYKKTVRFITLLFLACCLTTVYGYIWNSHYNIYFEHPYRSKGITFTIAAYLVVLLFISFLVGLQKIDERRIGDIVFSGILALIFVNAIAYVQISLIEAKLVKVFPFVYLIALQTLIIIVWAYLGTSIIKKLNPPQMMIIVYGSHLATELVLKMSEMIDKYTICESVNILDGFDRVCKAVEKYESVIICDVPSQLRNDILKYCYEKRKKVYIVPKISDVLIRGSFDINYFDCPLVCCEGVGLKREQQIIKRAIDIIFSLLVLIILSPLFLIIAAAIKIYDRGPVFYRQRRITLNGEEFDIIKFRSMIVNAEPDGKPKPAVNDDERITPVGRFMRRWRIDELPQIYNILRGEMSVVGPRAERVEHVKKYTKEIPEFAYRHKVKTGLTGYAQVYGKYNTTPYNKLKLDLMYIQNYSLLLDLKLILMTIKILFNKESTDGFDD